MLGILLLCSMQTAAKTVVDSSLKPRIVVLTDIAPTDLEPDDMESMVRLLVHADLYEIEGLIATGGWNSCGRSYPDEWMENMQKVINAYEEDLPNLMKRSGQKGFLPVEKEAGKQTLGYFLGRQRLDRAERHRKPELERIRNSYTKSRESRENISEKQIRSGRRHSFFPTCNPQWIKRSDRM